jgi:hypothetical protein
MDISYKPEENLGKSGKKHFHSDLSLWALIVSNLTVILWALIEGWPLAIIMWVYWSQSVTIGILWFFKILTLKEFSTKGFKINERSVKPTTGTKIQTAFFSLLITDSSILDMRFSCLRILKPSGYSRFCLWQDFSLFISVFLFSITKNGVINKSRI